MLFNVNRFHFFVMLAWQFSIFFGSQMLFPIFSNYIPKYRCLDEESDAVFHKNCSLYLKCNGTIDFENNYFHSSAMHFDWICGPKAYLAPVYSKVQFFGVLIGTIMFGALSDRFGRRPISLIVLTTGILVCSLSGMVPYWHLLLACRFVIGLSIGGVLVVVCTFVMEMLLPEQRMALRAFFNWGVGRLLLTLICYFFNDWQSASIACAVASLPALLIVFFVFPESPTWLKNQGRIEEMHNSERKIAKFAGLKYVEKEYEPPVKSRGLMSLLREGDFLRRVSVLWAMWFTASLCGYAIDLHSSDLSGNLYFNQVLFSVIIAVSKMVLVLYDTLNTNFSRRKLHQQSQSMVIICFLILTLLTLFASTYEGVFILIVNLIGIVFIEYTWDACYLCAVESMPTNMRAISVGTCSFMARVGALLAPSLAFLNRFWAPSAYMTVVVLGIVNVCISYAWLVETKGVVLDDVKIKDEDELNKKTVTNGELIKIVSKEEEDRLTVE
uniref:Major facilitator superfamily (MFS) profile domain-containing protein n=1 Tax=Acrobeloides nanus TaxID=290746 RepID=A0A914DUY0_9BILA